jgi:CBS domain-containing protein
LLDQSLKEALSAFVVQQQLQLPVTDGQGQQVGVLHLTDVIHTTP